MNQPNTPLPNVSREDENRYLSETLKVVEANTADYSRQVAQMQADIDDMLEHYHDNDMESLTELNNTVTLHEHMKMALEHNMRALSKPYFGRIIFKDHTLGRQESLYIGRGGISRDTIHPVVIDWRAPIANAYYESGLGECSYTAPGGQEMAIDLQLKRTYEIEDGKLKDYFDSEVIANDELLTRYLAKNKQAVLGEIVATIQKEQNEIIRLTPYRNLIVQGVAGSGKTTVAMHRISYILYNYAERFKPDDFYIVGSNRILLNYITGVLPELDVHGVRQMTMAQLFTRLLYEEWDEKKYRIRSSIRENIRGTLPWFKDLRAFCDRLEWDYVPHRDIYLDDERAAGGSPDAEASPPPEHVLLLSQDTIEKYIRENPSLSLQSKIDGLNERLMTRIHNHFLEHMGKYTEDERKEILRAFRGWFGGKKVKLSIFELYERFLNEQRTKGFSVTSPAKTVITSKPVRRVTELDVYDLAALAYLYARVPETEVIQEAHHVVIDEAQDFGMMAYAVLSHCIRGCTYTIMGDVSQNIHFGSGLNDWEELKALLLKDPADSFRVLKKSYRNTVEISEYALRILRHGIFSVYPVEPIIRHGKPVQEIRIEPPRRRMEQHEESVTGALPAWKSEAPSAEDVGRIRRHLIKRAARILKEWQSEGYNTLAVVCRDQESASRAAGELGEFIPVCGDDLENAVFSEGIMVLPVEYTKGLEFDAVLLLDPTSDEYPVDDGHAKLLYVAATRALHELCVIHSGSLTGLITEDASSPVSEYKQGVTGTLPAWKYEESVTGALPAWKYEQGVTGTLPAWKYEDNTGDRTSAFQKKTKADPTTLFFASGKSLQMPDPYDAENILKKARQGSAAQPVSTQHMRMRTESEVTYPVLKQPVSAPQASVRPASVQSASAKPVSAQQVSVQSASAQPASADPVSAQSISAKRASAQSAPRSESAVKNAMQNPMSSAAVRNDKASSRPHFGDIPADAALRQPGHSKIDLAVRWVSRQPEGLCLQSRYGVLRLSPVTSRIVRVSFAKPGQLKTAPHPGIAVSQTDKIWMYREISGAVELLTDELCLRIDKSTGAVLYMTRDRKPLLAEPPKDYRQLEAVGEASLSARLFLNLAKNENLTAVNTSRASLAPRLHGNTSRASLASCSHGNTSKASLAHQAAMNAGQSRSLTAEKAAQSCTADAQSHIPLSGTARFISQDDPLCPFPLVVSDRGYGLMAASGSPVIFCSLPGSAACIHITKCDQLDFYFLLGDEKECRTAYDYLCGR